MTIDLEEYFNQQEDIAFKKLKLEHSPIGIYCGLSGDGLPSIAFLTHRQPISIDSTKYLSVEQWYEQDNVYWTKFTLLLLNANSIFYSLCEDFIEAVQECNDETEALNTINNRYATWRKMFKKTISPMSEELYKGLLGELLFLHDYAFGNYGVNDSINAWSGPDFTSKDFSINADWFEVKSVSVNSESVKISSLAQLSSDVDGHLVVIQLEKMSCEYNDGKCSVAQLISKILDKIDNEDIKELFISKLASYGYSADVENEKLPKFKNISMKLYRVGEGFPRITENEVPYQEIVKVSYNISLNGIQEFLEVSVCENFRGI